MAVESIAALRAVCQKPDYKTVGNWMARHITRDMALYVTWLVLHTRLRADSIALVSLVCGLASAVLIAIPSASAFFAGALLLQLWYLLDHVDGQVARYYKEADLTGTFLDYMIHFLVHSAAGFGLGMRMFYATGAGGWVWIGFLCALAMGGISQFNDCKYKAFYQRLAQWGGKTVCLGTRQVAGASPCAHSQTFKIRLLKKGYTVLYKCTEIHVVMNVLGLSAALTLFGWPADRIFIWVYVALVPLVLLVRIFFTVRTHRIDDDFQKQFSLVKEKREEE